MGNVYRGIHEKIALLARDRFGLEALVETGTYRGETAAWAKDKFERVITIEMSDEFYKSAEERVGNAKNVLMIKGDTRQWLPTVCRGRDNRPTLFWLDAHYTGETNTEDPKGLALLDEINIINNTFFGKHAIMVDDYSAIKNKEWAKEEDIVRLLRDKEGKDRDVIVIDDIYFACQRMPQDIQSWKR